MTLLTVSPEYGNMLACRVTAGVPSVARHAALPGVGVFDTICTFSGDCKLTSPVRLCGRGRSR
jgi:hypothetical protein